MGRMSNLSSKRERNQREKRRRKRGLIIGSAVATLVLLCYVGHAYLQYRSDLTCVASNAENEDTETSAVTEEVSFADYLIPFRSAGSATETVTITASVHQGSGSVTPSVVRVEKGGTVTLKATPDAGYEVLCWYKGDTEIDHKSRILVLSNVTENAAYSVFFSHNAVHMSYKCEPEDGGYIFNEQEFVPLDKTTLTGDLECEARPNQGYHFKKWELTIGSATTASTANPGSFHFSPMENGIYQANLKAVFEADGNPDGHHSVKFHAVPAGSVGLIQSEHSPSPGAFPTIYEELVPDGTTSFQFTAYSLQSESLIYRAVWDAKDGSCPTTNDHHVTSSGFDIHDFTVTTDSITEDTDFIVSFSADSSVTTAASPSTGGTTAGDTVAGTGSVTTTISATPNRGFMFDHWEYYEGGDLKTNKNQNLTVTVSGHRLYTAIFVTDTYEIKGNCVPENGGTIFGLGKQPAHATATVRAIPVDDFQFDKWTYTTNDGVQHESTSPSLSLPDLDQDYLLTAHFSSSTPQLSVSVNPLGSSGEDYNYVRISGESSVTTTGTAGNIMIPVTNGSSLSLQAYANTGADYEFAYWVDQDGNTSSMNPLAVGNITEDMSYTAFFTKKESANGIKVLASPPSGGKVSAKKQDDGSIILSAKANRGYKFLYWKCADTNTLLTRSKTYTLSEADVERHYTYVAYFSYDKSVKVTSDITDEYFPNIRRLFTDPNYKYTRANWTLAVANYINSLRGNYPQASGTPNSYAAYKNAEEAANEKAAEAGPPEITVKSELITTDNEIIPITDTGDPDSGLERALSITMEKFGDRYTPEVICVKDVSAPNGFIDGVRTYIWSDTGVEMNDNLFIIYEMNGQERIVTPIADHKGNLRFTINKLGAQNRFTLVRVTVE